MMPLFDCFVWSAICTDICNLKKKTFPEKNPSLLLRLDNFLGRFKHDRVEGGDGVCREGGWSVFRGSQIKQRDRSAMVSHRGKLTHPSLTPTGTTATRGVVLQPNKTAPKVAEPQN